MPYILLLLLSPCGSIRAISLSSLSDTSSPSSIVNDEALYLDSRKGPLNTLTLALFGPDSFETWPQLAREPSQDTASGGPGRLSQHGTTRRAFSKPRWVSGYAKLHSTRVPRHRPIPLRPRRSTNSRKSDLLLAGEFPPSQHPPPRECIQRRYLCGKPSLSGIRQPFFRPACILGHGEGYFDPDVLSWRYRDGLDFATYLSAHAPRWTKQLD